MSTITLQQVGDYFQVRYLEMKIFELECFLKVATYPLNSQITVQRFIAIDQIKLLSEKIIELKKEN